MGSRWRDIQQAIVSSQFWKSIFRVGIPNTNRKRVLAMLGNVVLHLHPVKTRKSGVKMRYTWCAGGVMALLLVLVRSRLRLALVNIGHLLTAAEQFERGLDDPAPQAMLDVALLGDLGDRERDVVGAGTAPLPPPAGLRSHARRPQRPGTGRPEDPRTRPS